MTTHEVEEMLDITKKTLIYYENEGLVIIRKEQHRQSHKVHHLYHQLHH